MTTLSAVSTEYLRYQVTATVAGASHDPTADTVQFAFTPTPTSRPQTFVAGSWETIAGAHFALCLVGPTGGVTTLSPGVWTVWVQVTDSPEVPVRNVGTLTVI